MDDIFRMQQNSSVATLLAKQRQCGSIASFPCLKHSHQVSTSSSLVQFGTSIQQSISAGIQHQMDICKVNHALAQMAIADFFHCENIPDLVVELPRFKQMVFVLSMVGSDFEISK